MSFNNGKWRGADQIENLSPAQAAISILSNRPA
jgi:hypothetical protein